MVRKSVDVVALLAEACGKLPELPPPEDLTPMVNALIICSLRGSPDIAYAVLMATLAEGDAVFHLIPPNDLPPSWACFLDSESLRSVQGLEDLLVEYGLPLPKRERRIVAEEEEEGESRPVEKQFETVSALLFRGRKTGDAYAVLIIEVSDKKVYYPAPRGILDALVSRSRCRPPETPQPSPNAGEGEGESDRQT